MLCLWVLGTAVARQKCDDIDHQVHIGPISLITTFLLHARQAGLHQRFKMKRRVCQWHIEGGGDFTADHATRVGSHQQTECIESGFGCECRKGVQDDPLIGSLCMGLLFSHFLDHRQLIGKYLAVSIL